MVSASTSRVLRKGVPAFCAALTVAFSASAVSAAPARAADPGGGARSGASGTRAPDWTPTLTPFSPGQERVHRNLSGPQRQNYLENCGPKYLCVAAGEGDGQHTVYELYYCTERSLSNFIDAGAAANSQFGATAILRRRDRSVFQRIPPDPNKVVGVDWYPVWYLDPC
ncbi:hypothetical protein [Actinomadura fibrosa]|uniref:Secreted protein n=1 Tax=Actinomadura fibrosa TaxID=111802 RepID=A0ABW2XBI0_9ACTN|nr:hypothetical protein [Actinomadura fibrosa]